MSEFKHFSLANQNPVIFYSILHVELHNPQVTQVILLNQYRVEVLTKLLNPNPQNTGKLHQL